MRHALLSVFIGLMLAMSSPPATAQTPRPLAPGPSAAQSDVAYSVVYTGRLFGYFRYGSEQTDKQVSSCSDVTESLSGPSLAFDETLKTLTAAAPHILQVRAAVGDNFAPFLLARDIWFNGEFVSKDLVDFDDQSRSWVEAAKANDDLTERVVDGRAELAFDNVACFLRREQFDAIVPGKHDFYFGPTRLRALARLLARDPEPQQNPSFGRVQMLAANLSIVTTAPSRTPMPDQDIRPSRYVKAPTKGMHGASPVLPHVPLPWMRRLRIKNAFRVASVVDSAGKPVNANVEDLLAETEFDPTQLRRLSTLTTIDQVTLDDKIGRRFVVERNISAALICPSNATDPSDVEVPVTGTSGCVVLEPSLGEEEGKLSMTWPFHVPLAPGAAPEQDTRNEFALAADSNQAVCLYDTTPKTKPYCVPFSIRAPFFEPCAAAGAGRGCNTPLDPAVKPYVLKSNKGGAKVALFGVVDPSLREYIGRLNDTSLNQRFDGNRLKIDKSLETDLEVADPVEALAQLLQYCSADPDCSGARKILLAHMPRSKAAQVAARFVTGTFDLVIAQTEYERASGNLTVTRTIGINSDDVDSATEPTVVVPGPHFGRTDDLVRTRLQQAAVWITANGAKHERRKIVNTVVRVDKGVTPAPLPNGSGGPRSPTILAWLKQSRFSRPLFPPESMTTRSEKVALFEQLALTVLQNYCKSDIALIQHRDVYLSPSVEDAPLDQASLRIALDAIFWKGDFAMCDVATGATLKALLARSREVEAAEANGVSTDLETGRGLTALGLTKNGDEYLIAGQVLNDKKLYSIAITDFLEAGDTGYPELATATPLPTRVSQIGTLDRLSSLVFLDVIGNSKTTLLDTHLPAHDYLDSFMQRSFDTKSLSGRRKAGDWMRGFLGTGPNVQAMSDSERRTQQRSIWSVNLEALDVKWTSYNHSDDETIVNSQFSGIPISTLVSPDSSTVGLDVQLRVKWSTRMADFYSLTEMHDQHTSTNKSNDNGQVISEPQNQLAEEFGVAVNIRPFMQRSASTYKIIGAYRYETELEQPFVRVDLADARQTSEFYRYTRDDLKTFKIGVRHEYQDSYLELGWLSGTKQNSVTQFTFAGTLAGNPVGPISCAVAAEVSFKNCVNSKFDTPPMMTVATAPDHRQTGWFLNTRAHVPIGIGQIKYLFDETGQFFNIRDEDVSVDTRYRLDLKNSLEVPAIGNLSFAPSVEWFLFENKKRFTGFVSRSVSVELKYAFEWRTGLGWSRALWFANPIDK